MRLFSLLFIICLSFTLTSCKGESRTSVLQKCSILGNESISYARSNYVKLFKQFNPKKFNAAYNKIKDYDYVKHRNVINTYHMAVLKIKAKDPVTQALKNSTVALANFSKNLVDQTYPRAIAHKSSYNPLSNNFFTEINQIVRFDHNIGTFGGKAPSFKQLVNNYNLALIKYRKAFQSDLSIQ